MRNSLKIFINASDSLKIATLNPSGRGESEQHKRSLPQLAYVRVKKLLYPDVWVLAQGCMGTELLSQNKNGKVHLLFRFWHYVIQVKTNLIYSLGLFFLNRLKTKLNKTAPYITLLIGDAVMGQVPVVQPINFQYKKPATAPTPAPMKYNLFLRIKFCNILFFINLPK